MPDIVIHHIDPLMAERISSLAKARQWSINEALLHALRRGLGIAEAGNARAEARMDSDELNELASQWSANERAVFQEAMRALSTAQAGQLVPANRETVLIK